MSKARPITVEELISFLKTVKNPKTTIVGVSCDEEGNGFSAVPNDMFWCEGFLDPCLGYNELKTEQEEGTVPAIILWPSM